MVGFPRRMYRSGVWVVYVQTDIFLIGLNMYIKKNRLVFFAYLY